MSARAHHVLITLDDDEGAFRSIDRLACIDLTTGRREIRLEPRARCVTGLSLPRRKVSKK
jgi:hypothetical protein